MPLNQNYPEKETPPTISHQIASHPSIKYEFGNLIGTIRRIGFQVGLDQSTLNAAIHINAQNTSSLETLFLELLEKRLEQAIQKKHESSNS